MKNLIEHIKAAVENKNQEEIENIYASVLRESLSQSLFELLDSPYFPSLCSELYAEDDEDHEGHKQKAVDKLQEIRDGEAFLFLEPYDKEAIEEITECYYISLFEVALLIGYRVGNDPTMLVDEAPYLFCDAIINEQIDPREPTTLIPLSKLYKSPFVINEKVFFSKGSLNLSWELTLKEAAEFAILKGFPEYLFTDLLSDEIKSQEIEPNNPEKSTRLRALNQASLIFWSNAN